MDADNPFKKKAEEEKKKRQAEQERKAAEAAAQAKAKANLKKKAQRAVDDEWLGRSDGEDSDDDEMGFKMFSGGDLRSSGLSKPSEASKTPSLKVTNLIDFNECDLQEEDPPVMTSCPSIDPSLSMNNSAGDMAVYATSVSSADGPHTIEHDELCVEIQHLRQMLSDANEEKKIQFEIVKDEMAEKQQQLENLTRRCAMLEREKDDAEAALRIAQETINELDSQLAASPRLRGTVVEHAESQPATLQEMALPQNKDKQRVEETHADSTSHLVQGTSPSADIVPMSTQTIPLCALPLIDEMHALCEEALLALVGGIQPAPMCKMAGEGFEERLRNLRDVAVAVHQAAENSSATVKRDPLASLIVVPVSPRASHESLGVDSSLEEEAQAAVEGLGRHAAQALRELRLSAERQLEWITTRMDAHKS